MKDKKLEHIHNVIKPWDVEQFIRMCYIDTKWMGEIIDDKEVERYFSRVREAVYENWYAEEDLEKCIKDWKEIAKNMNGLEINLD